MEIYGGYDSIKSAFGKNRYLELPVARIVFSLSYPIQEYRQLIVLFRRGWSYCTT
jgi:hypothetical protein